MNNCPVTVEDITLAEKIFNNDVSTMKGKSTNKKSEIIVNDRVELPEELAMRSKDLKMEIYLIYIDIHILLVSIDRTLTFHVVVALDDRSKEEILEGLDTVRRHYRNEGYFITKIHWL